MRETGLKITLELFDIYPPTVGFKADWSWAESISAVASHVLITWNEGKVLLSRKEPSITEVPQTQWRDSTALNMYQFK